METVVPVEGALFGFPVLWLELYLAHVALYLALGYLLSRINERHPERKIQNRTSRVPAVREITQGYVSLAGSSLCLALGIWVQYMGWSMAPVEVMFPDLTGSLLLLGFFALSVVLGDIWFYAEHRLAHTSLLMPIHREHHRSPVPTPWSNDRFSFTEVILIQSYLFVVPFILPIPAVVLVAHRVYDQLKGMIGHGGYEYFEGRWARWPSPFTCVSHHDAHHERMSVNYGSFLTIWDRLFGTLEPGYDQKVEELTRQYRNL